jgi:hypothetical protein
MQERKFKNKRNYLLALLIGTIIFIAIFLFTRSLSSIEFDRIYSVQGEMAQDIFKDKIAYSLFDENSCSDEFFSKISSDLRNSGRIIDDLETKLGKTDKNVLEQKKFYTLILLEHLEFVKNYDKVCNSSTPIILFFYSNKKEEIDKNENIGNLLNIVASNHPNLVIYSFDVNLDSDLIQKIMNKYHIIKAPALLINENVTLDETTNINEIEKYLD